MSGMRGYRKFRAFITRLLNQNGAKPSVKTDSLRHEEGLLMPYTLQSFTSTMLFNPTNPMLRDSKQV